MLLLVLSMSHLFAQPLQKRTLKPNMEFLYLQTPSEVESLADMFAEGMWYGRLRTNIFFFNWAEEIPGKTKDHYTMGVGGSLVYKSGYLNHIGFTVAGYTSQNPWHMDDADAVYYKVGKADSNVLQLDILKTFEAYPALYAKVRMVNVNGDTDTVAIDGTSKMNPSYQEIRFELNYLF